MHDDVEATVPHPTLDDGGPRRTGPAPLVPFLQSLAASTIALWIIAALLSFFLDVDPVYTLAALGLLFAGQATHYRRQIEANPAFTVPGCKCGRSAADRTETVLGSDESRLLGVPNSVIGMAAYAAVSILTYQGLDGAAGIVAGAALVASGYLAWVMIVRLRALCSLCISSCAVNVLLAWYLLV